MNKEVGRWKLFSQNIAHNISMSSLMHILACLLYGLPLQDSRLYKEQSPKSGNPVSSQMFFFILLINFILNYCYSLW